MIAFSVVCHDLSEGHVTDGVSGYLFIFFAVWWAWMNFTWFASAFDTDDVAYRLTGLLMAALVFAGILAVREPGPTARPPALAEDQLAR